MTFKVRWRWKDSSRVAQVYRDSEAKTKLPKRAPIGKWEAAQDAEASTREEAEKICDEEQKIDGESQIDIVYEPDCLWDGETGMIFTQ